MVSPKLTSWNRAPRFVRFKLLLVKEFLGSLLGLCGYKATWQVAEKWSDVVILSEAKNLLFARGIENKADSSARQKAPGFRMTPQGAFSATC